MELKSIGIPQAMYYHEFGNVWKTFFEGLGMRVVLSGPTDAACLEYGLKRAPTDLCLPIKTMFGHVEKLLQRSDPPDCLFLPCMCKISGNCFTCPKTIGITDMLRASLSSLPPVISPRYLGNRKRFLSDAAYRLGYSRAECKSALRKTVRQNEPPRIEKTEGNATVAVIGHSYVLKDPYLNMNLFDKLERLDLTWITADSVPPNTLAHLANHTEYKKPFWHCANRSLGFTKYIADQKKADGVLFLNAFGCGTDSLAIEVCKAYLQNHTHIPAVTIALDEHAAQAGFVTRVEAFADCLAAQSVRSRKRAYE